jgi:tripartite-type tricarboxylate transporter receptor subunit TctC
LKTRLLHLLASSALMASFIVLPARTFAESWPTQPVRIINGPLGAGSSIDTTARILAEELSKRWKQTVFVENRPGADGIIAAKGLIDSRDGHTLLFTTTSLFTVVPLLREAIPYNPERDFTPISLGVEDFLAVVVAPSLQANSVADLIALAKGKPGELNFYAVPGAPYLGYLAFQRGTGINTTFVPYSNHTNAIADLSEGRLHIAVLPLAGIVELAHSHKLRLLAVTNDVRSPLAPNVPTMGEAGYRGFFTGGMLGMFGSKDMPEDARERVASDMRAVLDKPDVKNRLAVVGLIARGTSPAELAKIIDAQRAKWTAVVRDQGITPQ